MEEHRRSSLATGRIVSNPRLPRLYVRQATLVWVGNLWRVSAAGFRLRIHQSAL
jgi:hypothetical protein